MQRVSAFRPGLLDGGILRRPASGPTTTTEPAEPRGHHQERQLVNLKRRRGFNHGNPKSDIRTRKSARTAAYRRSARPAGDLRLCPAQSSRHEVYAHDCRERYAVERCCGRPPAQLAVLHPAIMRMKPTRKTRRRDRRVVFPMRPRCELRSPRQGEGTADFVNSRLDPPSRPSGVPRTDRLKLVQPTLRFSADVLPRCGYVDPA